LNEKDFERTICMEQKLCNVFLPLLLHERRRKMQMGVYKKETSCF
jgi:hypothetical protein